jgi:hypothetical protein
VKVRGAIPGKIQYSIATSKMPTMKTSARRLRREETTHRKKLRIFAIEPHRFPFSPRFKVRSPPMLGQQGAHLSVTPVIATEGGR